MDKYAQFCLQCLFVNAIISVMLLYLIIDLVINGVLNIKSRVIIRMNVGI